MNTRELLNSHITIDLTYDEVKMINSAMRQRASLHGVDDLKGNAFHVRCNLPMGFSQVAQDWELNHKSHSGYSTIGCRLEVWMNTVRILSAIYNKDIWYNPKKAREIGELRDKIQLGVSRALGYSHGE